jgi:hypothetical protein
VAEAGNIRPGTEVPNREADAMKSLPCYADVPRGGSIGRRRRRIQAAAEQ